MIGTYLGTNKVIPRYLELWVSEYWMKYGTVLVYAFSVDDYHALCSVYSSCCIAIQTRRFNFVCKQQYRHVSYLVAAARRVILSRVLVL